MIPVRSAFRASVLAGLVACTVPYSPAAAPSSLNLTVETPVWIDGRFPAEKRDAVERALGRWNVALGGVQVFFLASDNIDRPRDWLGLVPSGWGVTVSYDVEALGVAGDFLAQVFAERHVLFYASRFTYHSWESVALHEFGHVLGMQDGEAGSKLMVSLYSDGMQCIDQGTIKIISRRHPTWSQYLHPECE